LPGKEKLDTYAFFKQVYEHKYVCKLRYLMRQIVKYPEKQLYSMFPQVLNNNYFYKKKLAHSKKYQHLYAASSSNPTGQKVLIA
jgi:hypothetical protein